MSNKILQIKGFPLIKFHPSSRTEDLLNGCLYMKTLDWYRRLENEVSNCLVGDATEALWHINEATMMVTPVDGGDAKIDELRDTWFKTIHSDDFVFCMTGINPNQHRSFEFTQKQKDEIMGFGDAALLITDVYEFCRRILIAAGAQEYKITSGFVSYYDESIDEVNRIVSMMFDMRCIAFQKRECYAFQQEYRFLVTPDHKAEEDFIILEIGDIRDISAVHKTEHVLRSRLEEGKPHE